MLRMYKDKMVLIGLTMGLIVYLIFSFELSNQFPYFTTVLMVFSFSLIVFVAFMKEMDNIWYQRGFVVNALLALLLPFIEGTSFLFVSVIIFSVLAFSQYAMYLMKSDDRSNDE